MFVSRDGVEVDGTVCTMTISTPLDPEGYSK